MSSLMRRNGQAVWISSVSRTAASPSYSRKRRRRDLRRTALPHKTDEILDPADGRVLFAFTSPAAGASDPLSAQAARLRWSSWRNHLISGFQLVKMRLTNPRSRL